MDVQKAININVADRLENLPESDWDGSEPEFYRIELELDYLGTLELRGWWRACADLARFFVIST